MLENIAFGTALNIPEHGRVFQAGERVGRVTFITAGERDERKARLVISLGGEVLAGVDVDPEKYPSTAEQVGQALALLNDVTDLDKLVRPLIEQDMSVPA